MSEFHVWNIVRNDDLELVGQVVEVREGYGYTEPVYRVRYFNDGRELWGLAHMYTKLADTPQEWAAKNAETVKTNDGVPLDVANILRYNQILTTERHRMYNPEIIAAAQKLVDQWDEIYDGGILTESRFKGESVDAFGRDARAFYDLLKPVRGSLDWHPDTSSMLRIKSAAEALLLRVHNEEARRGAGDSGTH